MPLTDRKKFKKPAKRVLWVDLEMTGLSPEKDLILEVAAIATDWNFKEIASYHGVIKHRPTLIKRKMRGNKDFWETYSDLKEFMIQQSQGDDAKPMNEIEDELIEFIDKHFDKNEPVLLAGNSIHNDRRFIMKQWPRFDSRLHYRMLDVSAWKVVFESKYKQPFNKPDVHRALDDIRGSIAELESYLSRIK